MIAAGFLGLAWDAWFAGGGWTTPLDVGAWSPCGTGSGSRRHPGVWSSFQGKCSTHIPVSGTWAGLGSKPDPPPELVSIAWIDSALESASKLAPAGLS